MYQRVTSLHVTQTDHIGNDQLYDPGKMEGPGGLFDLIFE